MRPSQKLTDIKIANSTCFMALVGTWHRARHWDIADIGIQHSIE